MDPCVILRAYEEVFHGVVVVRGRRNVVLLSTELCLRALPPEMTHPRATQQHDFDIL